MLLLEDGDALFIRLKGKKANDIRTHKLSADWAADQRGKSLGAHGQVLLNLNDVQDVSAAFGLHRKHIVRSPAVKADVYLIRLYLSHSLDGCPQVALKGIARDARENVNQAIVSQFGQQGLLVALTYYAWTKTGRLDTRSARGV